MSFAKKNSIDIDQLKRVYFIGIGGIGMSALARHFNKLGVAVSGYDKTPTSLTDNLESEGISIHFEERPEALPKGIDLVVYTPAVPDSMRELVACRKAGLAVHKRAEVLGMITADHFTIAVAGSHGKTTVSSMIAHLLKANDIDCTAFLGGIALNYQSNYIPGGDKIFVVEADEYDRSFLQLYPDIAVVTAIDSDHLDVYGSKEAVEASFVAFIEKVKDGGKLVAKWGLSVHDHFPSRSQSYSLEENSADRFVTEHKLDETGNHFRVNRSSRAFELPFPGLYNVENALAAILVAESLDLPENGIADALANFKGIERRFEFVIREPELVFIDDYAHHPEEIKVLLKAARDMYGHKRITSVFQPHLFSRTRDLAAGFGESLSLSDELYLLDVYPAREEPIEGVSSALIAKHLKDTSYTLCAAKDLPGLIEKNRPEVLLTIGAGDIDRLVEPLKKMLEPQLK